jgi:hypothetical protein
MPVLVSDEKVRLGEAGPPFPVKTAMVAKCVKVFEFHVLQISLRTFFLKSVKLMDFIRNPLLPSEGGRFFRSCYF